MLQEKVLANIKRRHLLESIPKVVVAVSGGLDSVVLAHIFCALRQQLGIQLHIASLNHGIRGESAEADLRFVARLAREWRLPYTAGLANVPQLAVQNQLGLEEAGRQARYSFLARAAESANARCVAVGHHALDQAETIFMHVIRGSGLAGLRGMQFSSSMPGRPKVKLIRPLLNISRAELERYSAEHNLSFRHDESNDDTALQRNFIRHQALLPLLGRQPQLLASFARLAASAAIDEDYLATSFEREVLPQVTTTADSWQIRKTVFAGLHPAMKRRFLRRAFQRLAADAAALDYDGTAEAIAFCHRRDVGKRRDLGAGIQLRIGYESLHIERPSMLAEPKGYRLLPCGAEIILTAPMRLHLGDIHIELRLGKPPPIAAVMLTLPAGCKLLLRTRRVGDRLRPKGMKGRSRKLKDWMIDRKIPRALRDRIPVLCADGEIIAVCCRATWHLAELSRLDSLEHGAVAVILE